MTAPDLATRHRAALDVSPPRAPRAIEAVPALERTEAVPELPADPITTRLALVEGSVRFAKGAIGGTALALVAGAVNLIITITRVEERYDRLARDVATSTTQAATAKETGDRLTERLSAMSDRVERIDRALSTSLPAIQTSLEALRLDLSTRTNTPARRP